jgi:tetratricopeptide (TPR) repeat protein
MDFVMITIRSLTRETGRSAVLPIESLQKQLRELGRSASVAIHYMPGSPSAGAEDSACFLLEKPSAAVITKCKQIAQDLDCMVCLNDSVPMTEDAPKPTSRRLLEAGKAFCNLGLPEDAESQLRLAVEQDPGCAEAYHYLAAVLKRRNQSKKALQLTRKGLDANRDDAGFRYLLADLFADCDQLDQAISHLKEAIRLQPDSASPYVRLGQVFRQSGQTESATLAFEEALQRDVQNTEALAGLGSLYLDQGKLDLALLPLQQAVALEPNRAEWRLKLGWCLLHAGKSHQAEVEFLRVCNQEDASYKTSARFSLGRLYASQNHHSLAVELLQQVIEDQSDFEEARLLLAQSQSELGLFKDSLINFHTSLTNQPQRSKEIKPQIALCLSRLGEHNLAIPLAQECLLEQGAEFHLLELLASLYMAAEEWDEALITLLELQKKDHESAFLTYQIGWVYENLDEAETAEKHYVKALRIDPNLSEAYVGLGWLHYERDQKEVALVLFEKAWELEPLEAEMTDQVGWVHLLLNQLPEALRRFEEAIHLDQGNALYLCHKAATLYRLEQFAQAEDVIERALLMDPDPFVEAFCHFIIGISLEAQGLENSYERQMEESIELVPAEFVAMTGQNRALKGKEAWKQCRKEKKEVKRSRLKDAR